MLSAYFDIRTAEGAAAPADPATSFGKARRSKAGAPRGRDKPPKPSEAATTSLHAKFEPLPPEKNVPRPAEQPGQAWQGLQGTAARDDDVAAFRAEDEEEDIWAAEQDDDVELQEDRDDVSEPDFEPESLEFSSTESVSSSMDEAPSFLLGRKSLGNRQPVPVYAGPQLCCEDDDF